MSGLTHISESFESYKHRFAKQLLVQWLRDAAAATGYDNYAGFCSLGWRVNRDAPTYGVYEEYPINSSVRYRRSVSAWDETKWGRVPSFDELIQDSDPPEIIFDVAVQHKGSIAYAFEVVHKNPPSPLKALILDQLSVATYAVKADWILGQVKPPQELKFIAQYGGY